MDSLNSDSPFSNSPLPVDAILDDLRRALREKGSAVVQAPPGAGKTTRIPLALLNEPWLAGDKKILMLEPRRLAARGAADFMARSLGEKPGDTVGYRIRFEHRAGPRTRIEVLTEGILARRIQADPELADVGLVIFDEFHERSIQADLGLALCLDVRRGLREDLRLLVMSATLDGEPVARLLGNAPLVTSEGRAHPVEIIYLGEPSGRLEDAAGKAVFRALDEGEGDVLVFLPGAAEIRRTENLLNEWAAEQGRREAGGAKANGFVVTPLYGDLSRAAQDRALVPDPGGRRKIVLATPIAETSLTIPGVGAVVDSGFARAPRYDPGSGLSRLETIRIARDSAEQRAGRAGRLGPGRCYRLWTADAQHSLQPRTAPEILTTDPAPLALELAEWGVLKSHLPSPETGRREGAPGLAWLDEPPTGPLAGSAELLRDLGALNEDFSLSDTGKAMARLPLHPRLGRMFLAAAGDARLRAADIAALLSERDIITARPGEARSADFALRLEAMRSYREAGRDRDIARRYGADDAGLRRVLRVAEQIARIKTTGGEHHDISDGALLALAYPDRIGTRRSKNKDRYLLSSGRGATFAQGAQATPGDFLTAARLDGAGRDARILLAMELDLADLEKFFGESLKDEERVYWDGERVLARKETLLGAMPLRSRDIAEPDPELVAGALLAAIRDRGLRMLGWSPAAESLRARIRFLRESPQAKMNELPDLSDEHLLETLENWLLPFIAGMRGAVELNRLDPLTALEVLVGRENLRRVREMAPEKLRVPSGSEIRLEYREDQVILPVKLQEMFGAKDTPRIAGGRIPVTLHLLSPARRPIQVTRDLAGFWERTYGSVRKELRGRYPKHPWPEDPTTAAPTRHTKKRAARDSGFSS